MTAQKPTGRTRPSNDPVLALGQELAAVFEALFTIEGVEGVGQPVTVIDAGDLRPDFLGFIERLRGGAIEVDEEMLLITIAASQVRRRKRESALERLRQALGILCRYAADKGIPAGEVAVVLDEAKLRLQPEGKKPRARK